jgi:tRNA threonylcarbamoyladenosine biosynthesis protein TsaE
MSTEVVKCLGGDERLVGSPSFTLVNIYPISMGQFYHIDLYRLQGVVDEDDIDQDQWMEPDPHSISFIEWAERLDDWEPQQGYRCMIRHLEDGRCVRLERIH